MYEELSIDAKGFEEKGTFELTEDLLSLLLELIRH